VLHSASQWRGSRRLSAVRKDNKNWSTIHRASRSRRRRAKKPRYVVALVHSMTTSSAGMKHEDVYNKMQCIWVMRAILQPGALGVCAKIVASADRPNADGAAALTCYTPSRQDTTLPTRRACPTNPLLASELD
jgi:hypothetical protein